MKQHKTRQTLISRVTDQNDEAAWAEFVSYYEDYLKAVLRKFHLNDEEVGDAIQNTLLKIWQELPHFKYDPKRGRFRSWIAQVAINNMRVLIRKENRLKEAIDKNSSLSLEQDSLEHILEEEWQEFIAKKAWENLSADLSETMRNAFELHLQGYSSPEIGRRLDLSESSVRVYKQRVGYKLKYEMARLEQELN